MFKLHYLGLADAGWPWESAIFCSNCLKKWKFRCLKKPLEAGQQNCHKLLTKFSRTVTFTFAQKNKRMFHWNDSVRFFTLWARWWCAVCIYVRLVNVNYILYFCVGSMPGGSRCVAEFVVQRAAQQIPFSIIFLTCSLPWAEWSSRFLFLPMNPFLWHLPLPLAYACINWEASSLLRHAAAAAPHHHELDRNSLMVYYMRSNWCVCWFTGRLMHLDHFHFYILAIIIFIKFTNFKCFIFYFKY